MHCFFFASFHFIFRLYKSQVHKTQNCWFYGVNASTHEGHVKRMIDIVIKLYNRRWFPYHNLGVEISKIVLTPTCIPTNQLERLVNPQSCINVLVLLYITSTSMSSWMHFFFFFPNEATFPLVRKYYYKKTVHWAYIQTGKSPSEQVQKNEISYLA